MEIKQIYEEMQKTWADMKAVLDVQEQEIKKHGEASGETKGAIDKLNARLDELETKMNRPPAGRDGAPAEAPEVKAFVSYMRKGADKLLPEEIKALATDTDVEGGYLVPVQTRNRIIEKLVELSPIRSLASIETISVGNTLEVPKEGATDFAAGWTGERAARTETQAGKFAAESIPTHEMYASPRATQWMLDDAAFDVEGWIVRKVSQKMAVVEGTAFISGDSNGKPEGLLTHAGVVVVNSGNASLLTADGLINLFYSLPDAYARNATWLLRRATVGIIRQFKDNQGQYLWQMGIAMGQPAMILGAPYVECPDMPAVAANAFPVVLGDIRSGYQIVDRQGINVLRDPYSAKPFVEFYVTKRVGGQVVLAEAIRKQKIAA